MEYATADSIVCVTSIYNNEDDFDKLYRALVELEAKPHDEVEGLTSYPEVQINLSPKDAFYGRSKSIKLEDAICCTCAEYVIPYPPGIPLLSPGEAITKEIVDLIQLWKAKGHSIIGMKDEGLNSLLVIDDE